ncbi:MAG: sigma-70 family RNA polymerase sigma factor, partial [Anaerolineae bacterium]|nr:sigma-70 family RNA polymerase sigma factor [Anaerolineae bacterium]
MNRADQRGYLTFDDVLEVLDEEGDDISILETLLYELDELGVEIRHEHDPAAARIGDDNDIEFEPEELPQDPGVGDINAVSADDPVGLYFRQMALEPLLTAKDEIELAKRIESGKEALRCLKRPELRELYGFSWTTHLERIVQDGQASREHLGRANTRLVVSIAKRYMGQGLPFPDLIQEGNVGLMRAVDKYDYKRGNRFSTYATW